MTIAINMHTEKEIDQAKGLSIEHFLISRDNWQLKPETKKIIDQDINLIYDLINAFDAEVHSHPESVMKDLGISYLKYNASSMSDVVVFEYCSNVPDDLPDFIYRKT